jgi:HEPN domain-containing protein
MNPETRAEAAAWLAKARIDLRAARADLNASPAITSDALFHYQQAVEKALKGFLAAKEKPLQRTHDLESLGQLVLSIAPSVRDVVSGAYSLSIYASEFRYPGESPEPDLTTAETGIEIASRAVAAVASLLERDE